jgi:DNA-binding CsgD family transcriptional regulator
MAEPVTSIIHARSGGNPFFIRALAADAPNSDDSNSSSLHANDYAESHLPKTIEEVVAAQLENVSEKVVYLINLASLIGQEFSIAQLLAVDIGLTDAEKLDALEEAELGGLIEPSMTDRLGYRFSHQVVRQAIHDRLPLARRVRLHAIVAESLIVYYGDDAESHADEIVFHLSLAESIIDSCVLTRLSYLAAKHAAERGDFNGAFAHGERAHRLARGLGDYDMAPILEQMGVALAGIGRVGEAQSHFEECFDLYQESSRPDRALAVAMRPLSIANFPLLASFTAKALDIAVPGSLEEGWLKSRHGQAFQSGTMDRRSAMRLLEDSIEIARRFNDSNLELWSISRMATVCVFDNDIQGAQKAISSASLLSDSDSDKDAVAHHRLFGTLAYLGAGNINEVTSCVRDAVTVADSTGSAMRISPALSALTMVLELSGDFVGAQAAAKRALDLGEDPELALLWLAFTEFISGRSESGRDYLDQVGTDDSSASVRRSRIDPDGLFKANVALQIHEIEAIPEIVQSITINLERLSKIRDPHPLAASLRWQTNALVNLAVHDAQKCRLSLESESPHDQLTFLPTYGPAICLNRIRARLASESDEMSKADGFFEAALQDCIEQGSKIERTWTLIDYATHILDQQSVSRYGLARKLIDAAVNLAEETGAIALLLRASELKDRVLSESRNGSHNSLDLTARELEVIVLLAKGMSNAQIAVELFISTNTVARHIAGIFGKTRSENRVQAANFAREHGLLD